MMRRSKSKKFLIFLSACLILIFSINTPLEGNKIGEIDQTEYQLKNIKTSIKGWSITEVVSTESTGESTFPSIAIPEDMEQVYVVWADDTYYDGSGTDSDIFFKRWASGTWTTTEVVSTESTGDSTVPSIAYDNLNNAHVAWQDNTDYNGSGGDSDIFYKYWDSHTSFWTETEVVSTDDTLDSLEPSIAVDNSGNVHIAWYGGSGIEYSIFYKCKYASNNSWTDAEIISLGNYAATPSISTDSSGNIHVIWGDYINFIIYYRYFNAITHLWSAPEIISTESTSPSLYPSISVDSFDNVHVAWPDNTDYNGAGTDFDIFYKYLDCTSNIWSTTEVISNESTSDSTSPSIKVDDDGNIHLTWQDNTNYNGSGGDRDIFYKYKDYSANIWTKTDVISTESTLNSQNPSISVDIWGDVYIVWDDETNFNSAGLDADIFYKKLSMIPPNPGFAPIYPSIDYDGIIELVWDFLGIEDIWYVYRDTTFITSINGMVPITTIYNPWYFDTISVEGTYYYVIVAGNEFGNSSISNCESVQVILKPDVPILDPLTPNPDSDGIINLDWGDTSRAIYYYVYKDISIITSVDGMKPIANVSVSQYQDIIFVERIYFYVVVAGNNFGNSSISNCENVTVIFPPSTPTLELITPNPNIDGIINLDWNDVSGVINYYVYRDTSRIISISGMNPIATLSISQYQDIISVDNTYYYVIVAGNLGGNSSISNCEDVTVEILSEENPSQAITSFEIILIVSMIAIVSIFLVNIKKEQIT